jgi:hypothetical protein
MGEYDLGDTAESHRLRLEFYSSVLNELPTRPQVDFSRLARAWRAVTEADFVWLWLHNSVADGNQWEIREIDCASGDKEAFLPRALTVPARSAIVEYCHCTQRPELVDDIKGWTRTIGASRYIVACQDELIAMGCRSFLAIPFETPPVQGHNVEQRLGPLQGVICAHYRAARVPTRQPDEHLRLMALLTSSTIVHSYHSAQQDILIDLNTLAGCSLLGAPV